MGLIEEETENVNVLHILAAKRGKTWYFIIKKHQSCILLPLCAFLRFPTEDGHKC